MQSAKMDKIQPNRAGGYAALTDMTDTVRTE